MKVETHVNGSLQLIVIPENDLERTILLEFVARKDTGKKVTVRGVRTETEEPVLITLNLHLSVEA